VGGVDAALLGLAGSSTARFASFVRGPRVMLAYALTLHRRDTPHVRGHNALGAISVLVMLGLVLAVVVLGLFAVDVDGLYSGPLSSYVSFHDGRHLAHLHYKVFNILLVVIGLHLLAVGFYYIHKHHNLVLPMISGRCKVAGEVQEELNVAPTWRFLAGATIVALFVWAVAKGFYFGQ
jgi:cytochrome b